MHQRLVFLDTLQDFLQSAKAWHLEMRHTPGADPETGRGVAHWQALGIRDQALRGAPVVTVTRERDNGVVRASPVMAGSFVAEGVDDFAGRQAIRWQGAGVAEAPEICSLFLGQGLRAHVFPLVLAGSRGFLAVPFGLR